MNKAQLKRIEKGANLYDDFVGRLADTFNLPSRVSSPRTESCEMFALLGQHEHLSDLLYVAMMKEYLSNHREVRLSVEKGRLYETFETRQPF